MRAPIGRHPTNGRCSALLGRGARWVRALFHRGFMPLPLGGTALHLLKSRRAAMRRGAGPCIGVQKNPRPLELARRMPGSAQKCPEFGALGLAGFNPITVGSWMPIRGPDWALRLTRNGHLALHASVLSARMKASWKGRQRGIRCAAGSPSWLASQWRAARATASFIARSAKRVWRSLCSKAMPAAMRSRA
jgi:hypothetical protein